MQSSVGSVSITELTMESLPDLLDELGAPLRRAGTKHPVYPGVPTAAKFSASQSQPDSSWG